MTTEKKESSRYIPVWMFRLAAFIGIAFGSYQSFKNGNTGNKIESKVDMLTQMTMANNLAIRENNNAIGVVSDSLNSRYNWGKKEHIDIRAEFNYRFDTTSKAMAQLKQGWAK